MQQPNVKWFADMTKLIHEDSLKFSCDDHQSLSNCSEHDKSQWYSYQGIYNAEDFSTLREGSYMTIPWKKLNY